MEEKKVTEKKKEDAAMTREDFAVLWKTIHLKITDTYDVPPEILWVNVQLLAHWGISAHPQVKPKVKRRSIFLLLWQRH